MEYINEALAEDDGGYYYTTEFHTAIRFEDLQHVISDKCAGENNTFQSEYKVFYAITLQYITLPTIKSETNDSFSPVRKSLLALLYHIYHTMNVSSSKLAMI